MKRALLLVMLLLAGIATRVSAQGLQKMQQRQKAAIQSAFKKKQVTPKEYYKLQEEQKVIRKAMERAKADDYLSPKEQNDIYGKLQRAEKRLRKYKTNREVY
ncbi:hypothetical protein [Niabella aurantiaca]|uniref:hypothetical protein n=1 Tax=Niabella aurantiaca TaxID=379900 RepID=UPI00036A44F5|nr:hypothetical protein [Niabella aurantiaca]